MKNFLNFLSPYSHLLNYYIKNTDYEQQLAMSMNIVDTLLIAHIIQYEGYLYVCKEVKMSIACMVNG